MLKLILARDESNAIGYKGDIPWGRQYPEDLEYFSKVTTGGIVVMGRETFLSIKRPEGLPKRNNIVISSKPLDVKGNVTVMTIEVFREYIKGKQGKHCSTIWIIGGKLIYEEFIHMVDEMHITEIPGTHTADTFVDFGVEETRFKSTFRLKLPRNEKNNVTLEVNLLNRK